MYAVIRHYHFKPEDGKKIDRLVQEEFVPLIKKTKDLSAIIGWIPAKEKVHL